MKMMLLPVNQGRPFALEKAVVLFGRAADCDVVLAESKKVSRKHCCIAQIDDHFLIRDLGSLNGIRVNQRAIKTEAQIKPGDQIWIGDVGFHFVPLDRNALKAWRQAAAKAEQATAQPPRGKSRRQTRPTVDPHLLSQDIPVALPEGEEEFLVEESLPLRMSGRIPDQEVRVVDNHPGDSSEVIEIGEDDILD